VRTWLLTLGALAVYPGRFIEFVILFDILDGAAFKGVVFVGGKGVKG